MRFVLFRGHELGELLTLPAQHVGVDHDTGVLHALEHGDERYLDV